MPKKIFIIYSGNDWQKKSILENSPRTRQTLEDWQGRGLARGVEIYRANIDWYDAKTNCFNKSWTFRDKQWQKINLPVTPDFILDKLVGRQDYVMFELKLQLAGKANMINTPLFRTMLGNKLSQYLCLGEFMPKSLLVTRQSEFLSALKKIKTNKVVAKPIHGSGGFGIAIDTKDKIKKVAIEFPVILQECVTGGGGIPGFSQPGELADLRLVFIDHKLIYALSRIAKKGSLFTNFHQGAVVVLVPARVIPAAVRALVKKIIGKLTIYPQANYSLDFMFDRRGKPYLIEINTAPGLDLLQLVGTEKIKAKYFTEILRSLGV